MPTSIPEIAWWGFNLLLLVLGWFIKSDLKEIKEDSKENRRLQESNALAIAQIQATCAERHKG
jgi:hypothetical protein